MACREIQEQCWIELIAEIRNGNVIPIVGPQLSTISVDGEKILINEYLLKKLTKEKKIKLKVADFTQLKYSKEWMDVSNTSMQYEIHRLYHDLDPSPPECLRKLFKIKEFRLILSTTFDNLAEQALHDKYGEENFKTLHYEIRSPNKDISQLDLNDDRLTILFHMFGKLGKLKTSYVLTEDDLLKYMLNWINLSSSPKNLINYMQNKYLLVLGCDYPNVLFKFFLYAIKYNFESNKLSEIEEKSVVADRHLNDELERFLDSLKVKFHNDPEAFIDELLKHYEYIEEDTCGQNESVDIFISYAHEDGEMVSKIVNELKDCKVSVWFDKNTAEKDGLEPGDDFAKRIKQKIKNCTLFIPILSKNVLTSRRFFRYEWKWAIEIMEIEYKKYIVPLVIDKNIDLNHDAIPEGFKGLHIQEINASKLKESLQPLIRLINKDKRILMKTL